MTPLIQRHGPSKPDLLLSTLIYVIAAGLLLAGAYGWALIVLVAWLIAFGSRRD